MKKLLYFIICLLAVACGSNTESNKQLTQENYALVAEFYKTYIQQKFGDDTTAIQQFLEQEAESLDSCFLIHYTRPINGYDIRMKVDLIDRIVDNVVCDGQIVITNEDKTISIDQFIVNMSDSVFNGFKKQIINEIEFDIKKSPFQENLKYPHFGEYKSMPFFFFDADFDGVEELVIRDSGIGQRGLNCYYPIKLDWKKCNWEISENMICENSDTMSHTHFYPFDDMTQFDFANNVFILYLSAGWWDNEWDYYKVENGEGKLIKRIVEYDRNDPKVMRITYNGNDSTITSIPTFKDNSYSID